MRKYLSLILIAVSFFSCELKDIDFEGVENYKLEKFADNEATISLSLKVLNENWFGLKIKPSHLLVSADGKEIGTLYLDKKVKIKSKRSGTYDTKVRLKLNSGSMMKLMSLAGKKEVKLDFEGKVKGGVFIFSKKIKIHETKTINPRELNLNFMK